MPLKLTLKPHERVVLGGAVVKNGNSTCHFLVENNVPILRDVDILSESEASTPCRKIYFVIQLMYIDQAQITELQPIYWGLVREVLEAAPSMKALISKASQFIIDGKFYQALKTARKLIQYEEELIKNATEPC
ncbi:MAG TPA: flagellar biosynthesis repressor FlbT [Deltaproteobacteria bacterium]|nr:flagellar biosynthesis repressor FlbT [Deltaproteobacteria bacterium]HQB39687.1 flagellar biosynthesis repressor FlbT [Deltaproteobacteria bacterium]